MGFDMARELYTTIRASVSIDDFLAKCAARQLIRALKCTRGSIPGLAFGVIYGLAEDAALKQAMNNRIMGANHGANDCWGIRYQYGLTGWKVQMDAIESDVARQSLWSGTTSTPSCPARATAGCASSPACRPTRGWR